MLKKVYAALFILLTAGAARSQESTTAVLDIMRRVADWQIIEFKVMIRPLKAVNLIHQKMGEMLKR